ncbi:MAG: hypothetical protein ACXWOV_00210 [Isosphaeraceae bacterium]
MRFFLRLMGVEVFSIGAEINGDGQTQVHLLDGTGGLYELAEEPSEGDYDEELPKETYGFGFGVHRSGPPGAATFGGGVRR